MYKVHWIIDGIAEIKKKDQTQAEEEIRKKIQDFVEENSDFFTKSEIDQISSSFFPIHIMIYIML